jgi:hypothetical protein
VRYTTAAARFPDDGPTVLELWSCGLSRHRVADAKFRWYYERNPEGAPETVFLRYDGAPGAVGVATMGRRRMRLGDENVVGGCLVDFVVEPQHRSFYPALLLQKNLLRRGQEIRAVVFALPNPRAEAILRRAGYHRIGHMVRLVRVLRSRPYLARVLPGWISTALGAAIDHARLATTRLRRLQSSDYAWEWRAHPDADFDALWERAAPRGTLIGARDRAFLAWRFVESPFHAHRFFVVIAKADRRVVAYAVCHVQAQAMQVADFLVDAAAPGAGRQLWRELALEAYRTGHRSLSVEFLGAQAVRRELDALGMVDRGRRPLYAAFEDRHDLCAPSNWYVTNADEDG